MSGENPELPEHFPAISVDRSYGRLVDEIDPDINAIAELLAENGLSDEEIDETSIHFLPRGEDRALGELYGLYESKTKKISVYSNPIESFQEDSQTEKKSLLLRKANNYAKTHGNDAALSAVTNSVLRHELEHRISDADGGMEMHQKHQSKLRAKLLGNAALWIGGAIVGAKLFEKSFEDLSKPESVDFLAATASALYFGHEKVANKIEQESYQTNPEEIRARGAQENDLRRLVSVSLKNKEL